MAKKKEVLSEGTSLPSVFDLVKNVDDSVEIIAESAYSNISEWISTGNYILNACCSGNIYGGIPAGRITTLYGPSSCLQKNEKINIYIMKSNKEKIHNIYDERNSQEK